VVGYVPDEAVPALLRTATVVAYPSVDEGFGLPALEALACGAALVTTAGSVMATLCGDAPWLVDGADAGALAAGLDRVLVASEDERASRRSLGMLRAAGFTWELAADRHLEAYDLASGQRGRGRAN
jgi:glycosyltransferase involved in cell wall biosynthesis